MKHKNKKRNFKTPSTAKKKTFLLIHAQHKKKKYIFSSAGFQTHPNYFYNKNGLKCLKMNFNTNLLKFKILYTRNI